MFRTITSRYPGTCKRCRQPFEAGTRIRFGGYGRTYHLKAQCEVTAHELPSDTRDDGYGSQEWAETQADNLGDSPDF